MFSFASFRTFLFLLENQIISNSENNFEEPKTPLVEQTQSNAFESPPIPNEVPPPPPLENLDVSVTSNDGLCARAVYDYQADAEDEITFDPGEISLISQKKETVIIF